MNSQELTKAFEGRWRIKGFDTYEVRQLSGETVKALCRDFFEAGICLAQVEGDTPTPIPLSAILYADIEENGFDFFWDSYDKKVGRDKCKKLWAKLTVKEKTDCLAYIPLYKQAQPDKQYRKNPETFLRNKSWNDEIIFSSNAANTQPTIEQQRAEKLASILTE